MVEDAEVEALIRRKATSNLKFHNSNEVLEPAPFYFYGYVVDTYCSFC